MRGQRKCRVEQAMAGMNSKKQPPGSMELPWNDYTPVTSMRISDTINSPIDW